jgi:Pyruvate/2-oxoacid:ferredoxin oxidoreductase gamma subunit
LGGGLGAIHGPEMRGGTAYCLVVINDRPIGSPIVKKPLHLVAMNRPSLEKFAPILKPNVTVLINTTLIPVDTGRDNLYPVKVPATTIASRLVNSLILNMRWHLLMISMQDGFKSLPGVMANSMVTNSISRFICQPM